MHIIDFVELIDVLTDQIPSSGKHYLLPKRRIKKEPKF